MASGSPSTPAHTLGDALGVAVAQRESRGAPGARAPRTAPPRPNRPTPRRTRAACRQRHRRYRPDGLALHPQPRPARGQDDQPGSRLQQRPDRLGAAAEQMLAVVEHHQRAPRREVRARGLHLAAPRQRTHPERLRHRRANPSLDRPTTPGRPTTPRRGRSSRSAANSSASRVLPQPPGPVRVTRRACLSTARNWASSLSRPTKLVNATGSPRAGAKPRSGVTVPPPASNCSAWEVPASTTRPGRDSPDDPPSHSHRAPSAARGGGNRPDGGCSPACRRRQWLCARGDVNA